ncbi:hypothetical protein HPP92_021172 [Vanilla planifolia]|uniref:RING-type domain-containing protein n=1 Tax=Vanilla planifolia TaxID=51239 RepID=A0A835PYC1_VANPL|nr:hypothetical protein HPP92_021172 [Vanilla planifolia]
MATPKLPFHPYFSSLLLLLNRLLRILQIKHSASFGDLLVPFDAEGGSCRFKQAPGEEVVCVFCMSDVTDGGEVRRLRCSHLFHSSCLGNGSQRRADCLCVGDLWWWF